MTKARILVSHLMTDDGLYSRGEIVDISEDEIKRLSSSVKRIEPMVIKEYTKTKKSTEEEVKPKPATRKRSNNLKYTRN